MARSYNRSLAAANLYGSESLFKKQASSLSFLLLNLSNSSMNTVSLCPSLALVVRVGLTFYTDG